MADPTTIRAPIAVALGAIAGALGRYYLSLGCARWLGTDFPYGTLIVNLVGAWAMGLVITLVMQRSLLLPPEVQLLVTVGFLGSFTTFSTYALDVVSLAQARALLPALGYWLGSAILGIVSLYGGILTARFLR